MKALKIIIPVLLIALIGVGVFFYSTSDFQLSAEYHIKRAESAYDRGRLLSAADHYEMALDKSPDDIDTTLALAGIYTELGNYTKTEYTLVRGISFMPAQTQLYIALSRAYVAQDKLLDAVTMLSGISNPSADEIISAMRPVPPTVSPGGGEYEEYLNISLSYSAGCNAYFSTDGSYPSTVEGMYGDAFEITESTTLTAISVSAEGLVSEPVTVDFSISHVVVDVAFTDPEIERVVREVLEADEGTILTTEDLWKIQTLTIPETALTLEDLRWFSELPGIVFTSVEGFDLTQLNQLENLKELTVAGCRLSSAEMQIIGSLTGLVYLDVSGTTIASLDPLRSLTGLRALLASDNNIVSLKPLSGLTGIEILDISFNAVDDLSPLSGMISMRSINLSYNLLSDIGALSSMKQLYYVNISNNSISSVSALEGTAALEDFDCSYNTVATLEPLRKSTAMKTLSVQNNKLTNIDIVSGMTSLSYLNASYNELTDVPSFLNHDSLIRIYLTNNMLTTIESFVGAPSLNYLDLDYNEIEDVTALAGNFVLVELNVFGNNVTETRVLTDAGIIVNK